MSVVLSRQLALGPGHDAPSGAHCSWKERGSARRAPQRWRTDACTRKVRACELCAPVLFHVFAG